MELLGQPSRAWILRPFPQHGQSQMAYPALKQSRIPKLRTVETLFHQDLSYAHRNADLPCLAQTEKQKLREGRAWSALQPLCQSQALGPLGRHFLLHV